MATTLQAVCEIGGVDYGARGNGYLRRLRLRPGSGSGVGSGDGSRRNGEIADIWLEIPTGTAYSFQARQEVKIYYVNATTGNLSGRYMGGFIRTRSSGKVAGGTNRTVRLVVNTYDVVLDALVSGAAGYVTIAAGTIGTQLGSVLTNFNGGAARPVNLTVLGVAPWTTAVLPAIAYSGRSLRFVVEQILSNADATTGGTRARYHVGLDVTTGAVAFGDPRLYVYDAASPPPAGAATWQFADSGVGGAVKAVWDPFEYSLDVSAQVNRQQSILRDGTVTTGSDAGSIASYPNPFSPHGSWQGLPVRDLISANSTEAAAALARRLAATALPHKVIKVRTNERVLLFDWAAITWSPDSLSGAWYQVVGLDFDFSQPDDPWGDLWLSTDAGVANSGPGQEPAPGAPGAPTGLAATVKTLTPDGRRGVMELTWVAPADGSSSIINHYEISRRIDINRDTVTYTDWSPAEKVIGASTSWAFELDLEEQYEIRARSVDGYGDVSGWSTSLVETISAGVYDDLPNPGFEIPRSVKSTVPDAWDVVSGSPVLDTAQVYEGVRSLKIPASVLVSGQVSSRRVRVNVGQVYLLRLRAKSDNVVPANFLVEATWYDKAGSTISTTTELAATTVPTSFTLEEAKLSPPAGACSVRIQPKVSSGTLYNVWIDAIQLFPLVVTSDLADLGITYAKLGADLVGTAFPGSPATNQPFWRSDLGHWYWWDGASWLGPR
jgi:hypothetical protein